MIQKMVENRSLYMGYFPYPGYVETGAFQDIYKCKRPGVMAETLLAFASYFSATLTLYAFKENDMGMDTEKNSTFKGLLNGTIHAAGPDLLWYLDERLRNVPTVSFPMGKKI